MEFKCRWRKCAGANGPEDDCRVGPSAPLPHDKQQKPTKIPTPSESIDERLGSQPARLGSRCDELRPAPRLHIIADPPRVCFDGCPRRPTVLLAQYTKREPGLQSEPAGARAGADSRAKD